MPVLATSDFKVVFFHYHNGNYVEYAILNQRISSSGAESIAVIC